LLLCLNYESLIVCLSILQEETTIVSRRVQPLHDAVPRTNHDLPECSTGIVVWKSEVVVEAGPMNLDAVEIISAVTATKWPPQTMNATVIPIWSPTNSVQYQYIVKCSYSWPHLFVTLRSGQKWLLVSKAHAGGKCTLPNLMPQENAILVNRLQLMYNWLDQE